MTGVQTCALPIFVSEVKAFLTDIVYYALRVFGQYTFSTYTVVKNGREIYTSSSMYFFYHTDEYSVYRIDRAKYNVCKWIDRQCNMYFKTYGEEPVINDTDNYIYDFILHKVDNQPYVRIHRGNFTGKTHTLITRHYRPYKHSYHFAPEVELTIYCPNNDNESSSLTTENNKNDGETNNTAYNTENERLSPKVFKLNLKSPHHFFLEKNELLDVKFLYGHWDKAKAD